MIARIPTALDWAGLLVGLAVLIVIAIIGALLFFEDDGPEAWQERKAERRRYYDALADEARARKEIE